MSEPSSDPQLRASRVLEDAEDNMVVIVLDDDERARLAPSPLESLGSASTGEEPVVVLPNGWDQLDRVPVVTADLSWIAPAPRPRRSGWQQLCRAWRSLTGSSSSQPIRSPLRARPR